MIFLGGTMNRREMERYLKRLGQELHQQHLTGEIIIAGGAAMSLALGSRRATRDIDAYFLTESQAIRVARYHIAQAFGLPDDWLNDGVKGFFHTQPPTSLIREYPGLRVYAVAPEYLFAMKASAGRPQDIRDLKHLMMHLNLTSAEEALELIQQYVPAPRLVPKVRYIIESLFAERG
jgi:predicted nucleotidyltransferase